MCMRVYVNRTCDISMLGSSILPAMIEARLYVYACLCVSTCDISMLGSSILPAMNEARLDMYACLCE